MVFLIIFLAGALIVPLLMLFTILVIEKAFFHGMSDEERDREWRRIISWED